MVEKLFEYAILFTPGKTKKDEEEGKEPKTILLKDITRILAKDEGEVTLKAAREIPEEYLEKLQQVTIAVRPF